MKTVIHNAKQDSEILTENHGVVVSVRGSVVEVRFEHRLAPIHSLLHTGENDEIIIEVLAHLDARKVRGIALTPTQGLTRGMTVKDTGGPLNIVRCRVYAKDIAIKNMIAYINAPGNRVVQEQPVAGAYTSNVC